MTAKDWLERIKSAQARPQQAAAPVQTGQDQTKRPRYALKERMFQTVDDDSVDFEFESPNQWFGARLNLIPLQSAMQGGRGFYGARFANQALPIANREAPLVQNLSDQDAQGRTFDEILGENAGAIRTKDEGVIENIDQDKITLRTPTGRTEYDLYHNFPMNRKTSLHNKPVVKVGDEVKPGDLLASSNYTDDSGTLALGVNARTAILPYKGQSMDDAIVISQAFANRLKSDHLYSYENEYKGGIKGGKSHFQGLFPEKFTNRQLGRLDDEGIIREGETIEPGDPLILSTKPRTISSTNKSLGLLSKHMQNARTDASLTWDHDFPGKVTDVRRTKKGVKVNVSTQQPTQEGDKIVYRSGQKCYHPDTEVFTDQGWVRVDELTCDHRIAALHDRSDGDGEQQFVARFEHPKAVFSYRHDGELFGLDATHAKYLVTPNHRVWRQGNSKQCDWYCLDARRIHGSAQRFMLAAEFDQPAVDPEYFELEPQIHDKSNQPIGHGHRFPFQAWVEFMAIYLADGNVSHSDTVDHSITFTTQDATYGQLMEDIFDRMGLEWAYNGKQYSVGPNKPLRRYLDQFGKALEKFVPQEIKQASIPTIRRFLRVIWEGDGDGQKGANYWTSSSQLKDDIEYLLRLTGHAVTISQRSREDGEYRGYQLKRNGPSYCLHILGVGVASTRKNYENAYYKVPYNGPVYCPQVGGLGVILTRFHGQAMWNGNSIVSHVIPDEQMPRTEDGKPLEVLLNPLGIPSRVNPSINFELLMGKVARRLGKPAKVPAFNNPDEKWYDMVQSALDEQGLSSEEKVFDPQAGKMLENPVLVGDGHILKLHHTGESKISARGQGAYTSEQMPLHGGGEAGQSKRLSGLETSSLLSSGAYNFLREGATLRGQRNDEYWRRIREGYEPDEPGVPFVWDKFMALLNGAGYQAQKLGKGGRRRLTFMTDKDLDENHPSEIREQKMLDSRTLEPTEGGLFDSKMVNAGSWGKIPMDRPMPNPAAEKVIKKLLGLTDKQYRAILAGEEELPEHLR